MLFTDDSVAIRLPYLMIALIHILCQDKEESQWT